MDEILSFMAIVGAICASTFYYPRKWLIGSLQPESGSRFMAFVHVLQLLQATITIFLLIGIFGIHVLQVQTVLWFFWGMFYLPVFEIVFHVSLAMILAALLWVTLRGIQQGYLLKAIACCVVLSLSNAINFGLINYFGTK